MRKSILTQTQKEDLKLYAVPVIFFLSNFIPTVMVAILNRHLSPQLVAETLLTAALCILITKKLRWAYVVGMILTGIVPFCYVFITLHLIGLGSLGLFASPLLIINVLLYAAFFIYCYQGNRRLNGSP